jgi:dTDP-4-amino-4,6-dideoxygalactose transaminase
VDALRAHGIDCGVHYARNDQYAMYEEAELPQVAAFCARVVSLPLYLDLTEDDVAMVCQAIRKGW